MKMKKQGEKFEGWKKGPDIKKSRMIKHNVIT